MTAKIFDKGFHATGVRQGAQQWDFRSSNQPLAFCTTSTLQSQMTDLAKHLHVQVLADWTVRYGSIYKFNLSGLDFLVITDPEEVTKLSSRELSLPKANKFYKGLNTVGTCVSPGHLV